MCIICYHEEGKPMPTLQEIQNCWSNNPDGAGLAWYLPDEDMWQVEKGFMNQQAFEDRYEELDFKKEDLFVLHWRISTSGLVDAARTHPFPLTDRCENMTTLKYKRKKIVFHNGVVGAGEGDFSDTMVAIRDWVDPLWKYVKDDKIYYLLEDLWSPSRVLICEGDSIMELGNWITNEGLMWSNDGFKEDKWTKWNKEYDQRRAAGRAAWGSYVPYKPIDTTTAGEWESPYRDATGDFDWGKFHENEANANRADMWDDWELPDAMDAESVAPNETEEADDNPFYDSVVGMVNPNDLTVTMDNTYREKEVTQNFLMCPNCYEEKNLLDSPFNMGDTICLVCGCVYDDPSGEQVYYDPDINGGFVDHQKEVANGHA